MSVKDLVLAYYAARDRRNAVQTAYDEALERGVLDGEELADVEHELYYAAIALDIADDDMRSFGLDPDNLPEEHLP
jgi:hypothetical protein